MSDIYNIIREILFPLIRGQNYLHVSILSKKKLLRDPDTPSIRFLPPTSPED